MSEAALRSYLGKIEQEYRKGDATEHSYRPAFKDLLDALGHSQQISATNEPKRGKHGAPDYRVVRQQGQNRFTIGYVEAKDIGKALDEEEKSEQLQRYRGNLHNLILTDYLEFRWYLNGEHRKTVRLAHIGAGGRFTLEKDGLHDVEQLLQAFLGTRAEEISQPRDLAERMARLTRMIRDTVVKAFEAGEAPSALRDLHQAFQDVLIPNLSIPYFADMFAQTLAYGLFAARYNHSSTEPFRRQDATREIPKTNPFLRKLFNTISGSDLDDESFMRFVDDLAQLLAQADMAAILRGFGKRTRQEDPVVHFYETFLTAYDPKLRELRGVYYTPEPVVSYIVRSVDSLLKAHFNCPNGLAERISADKPEVLLLDPACGTGTFSYMVIDLIRERFRQQRQAGMWSAYVREHLLPRLFSFELLMAPYAVAHLKLGMQLAGLDLPEAERANWAYDFQSEERLGIYLTNTLEEARLRGEVTPFVRYISEEANAAADIKLNLPIMVVYGNPPYSNYGQMNKGKWILDQLEDYKKDLDEKKLNLDDDFIKFIRFGQWRIDRTGAGILAFITNNTYLDGITHRRMRQSLMETFTDIYILDLHGSVKKRERAPDGSKDENVFDIQQGVAIGIFVKEPGKSGPARVHHAELWGLREHKYAKLSELNIDTTAWIKLAPKARYYFFVPRNLDENLEYQQFSSTPEIFGTWSSGIQTKRDRVAVAETKGHLLAVLRDFATMDIETIRHKYDLPPDGRDWTIKWASEHASEIIKKGEGLSPILYRPFDNRWTVIDNQSKGIVAYPRFEVMRHMQKSNLGLILTRQLSLPSFQHVWVTRYPIDGNTLSLQTREYNYLFPLYLYPNAKKGDLWGEDMRTNAPSGRRPNLAPDFIKDFSAKLGMTWVEDGEGDRQQTFGPEDVFSYLYAVLHAPSYRERYAEFLKIDFPRLPLTSNADLFRALCALGDELVRLHLLEGGIPFITSYPERGNNRVEDVRYTDPIPGGAQGRVYINNTQYFDGVPPEVWAFHIGGYQVCQKWLKDRKGRTLTLDEMEHYQKTIAALNSTIHLMDEIDDAIEEHGGWPIA